MEFNPESKEIIYRLQSFAGQTIKFILFFDDEEKKFILKNPNKNFKSADVIAVKNFNIHQSRKRLHDELKAVVVEYIDNPKDIQ